MPGADAPAARIVRIMRHGHTGNARTSPRNGLRLLRALPGDRLFCHRHLRNCFHRLDTSVEMSGPHDLAVRKLHRPSRAPPASITAHPYVRDVRVTPLRVERDAIDID